MDKIDKIEITTSNLSNQIGGLLERTANIESRVESNSSKLQQVNEEVASLSASVELHGEAIAKLTTIKTVVLDKNNSALKEMKDLIETQKTQVSSLQDDSQQRDEALMHRIQAQIDKKVDALSQDISFQALKDKAFDDRKNLVITGMKEDSSKSPASSVKELFKTMGMGRAVFTDVFRVGTQRVEDSSYSRPLVVKFKHLADRNKIWRKRTSINQEEGAPRIRIQADLPKKLREEINILYRVTRAAAKTDNFRSASVRNYAVQLHEKEYTPSKLETLPHPLRPSTISNPKSENAIAFFSKYSALSNHHPSIFNLNGQEFHNMEHYLAFNKATLSGQQAVIDRALQATDAKEAKAVLNFLKEDHPREWSDQVESTTLEGLRAKFLQNSHLMSFLRETKPLLIGEASRNERWGVGMDLDNPELLDTTKWNPAGNLLGKCLMSIRDELC